MPELTVLLARIALENWLSMMTWGWSDLVLTSRGTAEPSRDE